jgi:hypothetical protein
MDPRERIDDLGAGLKAALDGLQSKLWTGFPGIIVSFDAAAMTAVVQPAIQGIQSKQDGSTAPLTMPQLLDCPVQFAGGGGVSLTMPLKKDDEVWVSIANRCIDAWFQSGGVQPQMEQRLHNLSDGFCFPRIWSQPNVLTDVSTTAAELRSDDRSTFIQLDPEAQTVNITAPGGSTIDANVTINGTLHVTQQITCDADVVASGISLKNHTHSDPQGGETGGPTG